MSLLDLLNQVPCKECIEKYLELKEEYKNEKNQITVIDVLLEKVLKLQYEPHREGRNCIS